MNLSTVLLLVLTTTRIAVPGIALYETGPDGEERAITLPHSQNLTITLANTADIKGRAEVYLPNTIVPQTSARLLPDSTPTSDEPESTTKKKIKIKNYWGSHKSVPEGQPLQKATTGIELEMGTLPTGSVLSWPDFSKPKLPKPESAVGNYVLSTDFCGTAVFDIPAAQDFMQPIDVAQFPLKPNLNQHITLNWKEVPGAVAYFVLAMGGNSNESIIWNSGSTAEFPDGLDASPLTEKELETMLEKEILMSPTQLSCTIPAGIFKDANTFVVNLLAISTDRVENQDGISVRIIRRSLVSMPFSNVDTWRDK